MLRQSSSGIWQVDVTVGARRVQRSAGTKDKKAAQEFHDRVKTELWRQVKLGEKPRITFADASELFMNRVEQDDLDSWRDLQIRCNWLIEQIGDTLCDEMTKRDIVSALEKKRKEPGRRTLSSGVKATISNATINRYRSAIIGVLKAAHDSGYATVDYKEILPAKANEKSLKVNFLTPEQATKLLDELPDYLKPMVEFSLATGLRKQNVNQLRWKQVDEAQRIAMFQPGEVKNDLPFACSLNDDAMRVLAAQKGKSKTWVFPSPDDATKTLLDPAKKAWWAALKRAGIEGFRWHDLRRTWATWHVQSGTPLEVLKELGGWESLEMVLVYAQFAPKFVASHASAVAGWNAKQVADDSQTANASEKSCSEAQR